MKTNVHIYPSPITNESRMQKIVKFLVKNNFFDKIYIIGKAAKDLPERQQLFPNVEIIRISDNSENSTGGIVSKVKSNLRWSKNVKSFLKNIQVDCVNCHSLPVLPLCYSISKKKKAKLIYDTHELETETAANTGIRKLFSKIIERYYIYKVDEISVVGNYIADWYQQKYKIRRPYVVRNIPSISIKDTKQRYNHFRNLFHIKEEERIFLYQGYLGEGRGIERIIEVFKQVEPNNHIVFMGYGEMKAHIDNICKQYPNFHYLPAVSPDILHEYTSSADIGLCLIENVCLSYYYSLPNKLFEFILNGLPVFINPLPEQVKVVEELKCGWIAPESNDLFIKQINQLESSEIDDFKNKALVAYEKYSWEMEEKVLFEMYKHLNL